MSKVHEVTVQVVLQFDSVCERDFPAHERNRACCEAVDNAIERAEQDGFVHHLADHATIGLVEIALDPAQPLDEVLSSDCAYLWLRVGDAGEYEKCDDLDNAIEYLNELRVGKIIGWVKGGFQTVNYHGQDYISLYYGDHEGNHLADIGEDEDEAQEYHRLYVECNLEESEL